MINALMLILQYGFGIIFVVTAIGKLLDNRGFAEILRTYELFPPQILLPFALSVSLIELILGYFILRGEYLRYCAAATLAIFAGYLLIAIITNIRGLRLPNCGCFGVFWGRPMTWQTVAEDGALVAFSLAFFLLVGKQ